MTAWCFREGNTMRIRIKKTGEILEAESLYAIWIIKEGKWAKQFITKGDANAKKDEEPVPASRVLGVVVGRVPYVGWVKIVMSDFGLFIPILIILSVPLIISIFWDLVKEEKEEEEDEEYKEVSVKELILEQQKSSKDLNKDKTEVEKSSEDEFDF